MQVPFGKRIIFGRTPFALFRSGNASGPQFTHLRNECEVFPFMKPLSSEFLVVQYGIDVMKCMPHWLWCPAKEMALNRYKELLTEAGRVPPWELVDKGSVPTLAKVAMDKGSLIARAVVEAANHLVDLLIQLPDENEDQASELKNDRGYLLAVHKALVGSAGIPGLYQPFSAENVVQQGRNSSPFLRAYSTTASSPYRPMPAKLRFYLERYLTHLAEQAEKEEDEDLRAEMENDAAYLAAMIHTGEMPAC